MSQQAPKEPTLHTRLVDIACEEPYRRIEETLVATARHSACEVGKLVYQAYSEGLRDGFVQGIQAASEQDDA